MNLGLLAVLATAVGCGGASDPPNLPYLGQPVPGLTPQRFAPGIVSTDAIELNAVFSVDGREFYFTRVVEGLDTMHQMELVDGRWREARELMLFPDNRRVEAADMVLAPDGQTLYFLARYERAGTGAVANYDLWVSRRINSVWGPAELLASPISTAAVELYPVLGGDGSLYFGSNRGDRKQIYRAQRRDDGAFEPPATFGPSTAGLAGGDMALAPDESYLIMTPSRAGTSGTGDVHVSFRREDGSWGDLIRLDDTINTPDHEWCPMVTPDGKYLFFSRLTGPAGPPWVASTTGDVYWVDVRILDTYRAGQRR